MKKIILFLLLVLNVNLSFSQNEIYVMSGRETSPGVITFNWRCDTIELPYCYFFIGEYEGLTDGFGYTHSFVALMHQKTSDFFKEGVEHNQLMECTTEYILSNDTLEEHLNYLDENYMQWKDLWFKHVNNDNRTLKNGYYVVGIGTGNGVFQSGGMRSLVLKLDGNNVESLVIINSELNVYKYLNANGVLFIKYYDMVFDIIGNRIK